MEQFFVYICTVFQLNYGQVNTACNTAINASYTQAGIKNTYNLTQGYLEKQLYSTVDRSIIYSIAGIGSGVNAYNQREIKVSAPLNPFFNSISLDLNMNGQETVNVSKTWLW